MSAQPLDPVRWFGALGSCYVCGKPAHGKLIGPRNESHGWYCTKCVLIRLNKAEAARKKSEAAIAKATGMGQERARRFPDPAPASPDNGAGKRSGHRRRNHEAGPSLLSPSPKDPK